MQAYEFYWLDPKGRHQLIGVLPERRKKPERITEESIAHWGENVFGRDLDLKDIYFIQVTINEYTGCVFLPISTFLTEQ
jgi:hypothetical protein